MSGWTNQAFDWADQVSGGTNQAFDWADQVSGGTDPGADGAVCGTREEECEEGHALGALMD